jgi:hypothetical protein
MMNDADATAGRCSQESHWNQATGGARDGGVRRWTEGNRAGVPRSAAPGEDTGGGATAKPTGAMPEKGVAPHMSGQAGQSGLSGIDPGGDAAPACPHMSGVAWPTMAGRAKVDNTACTAMA